MLFAAERPDEKLTRKMQIVRMGIRVIQGTIAPPGPRSSVVYSQPAERTSTTPPPPPPLPPTSGQHAKPQRTKSAGGAEDENEIKPDGGELEAYSQRSLARE